MGSVLDHRPSDPLHCSVVMSCRSSALWARWTSRCLGIHRVWHRGRRKCGGDQCPGHTPGAHCASFFFFTIPHPCLLLPPSPNNLENLLAVSRNVAHPLPPVYDEQRGTRQRSGHPRPHKRRRSAHGPRHRPQRSSTTGRAEGSIPTLRRIVQRRGAREGTGTVEHKAAERPRAVTHRAEECSGTQANATTDPHERRNRRRHNNRTT